MVLIQLQIVIPPTVLDDKLQEYVEKKTRDLLLHREVRSIGYIKHLNKIDIDTNNFTILYSGNIKCKTLVDADVYLPKVGDILKTKIKSVSLHGYYLDEHLETFVMLSKEDITKREGDTIKVKVVKVNYTNDHFIILASKNLPLHSSS